MNNLFKYIKPNPYPLCTKYGYGIIPITTDKYEKANKRKVLRYIRHYGFDITETWSLDFTIMRWLSDHVGGFFRECGDRSTWDEIDLEGHSYDTSENCIEAEKARIQEFKKQLKEFLETANKDILVEFQDFVIPRLRYLSQHTHGYPVTYNNGNHWRLTLMEMANTFEMGYYDERFVEDFFLLWD